MPTTPTTTIKEENKPVLKPPPVQAFIKLSKYIPVGNVNPETRVPGSLKAKNNIEKKGYSTIKQPNKKIEWAIIFSRSIGLIFLSECNYD